MHQGHHHAWDSVIVPGRGTLDVRWLGRLAYAPAFALQQAQLEHQLALRDQPATVDGSRTIGTLLLVEHDPVITISNRAGAADHLLASREHLHQLGIDVQPTDRGGDITYHGPGQLVAYPIVDLNLLGLRLHEYMRALESAVIDTCAHFGVPAQRDPGATGVWVPGAMGAPSAKVAAMGVRVRRWITLHGLAINVTTNLRHFDLIVPCGLVGRPVTSLHAQTGHAFELQDVARALVPRLAQALAFGQPGPSTGTDP
jgi:lipoyl(octanoyl) transferase